MKVGIVGLGKMGQAIAQRLLNVKHEVWGFDTNLDNLKCAEIFGVRCVSQIEMLQDHVNIFWIMVPAGKPVDTVINTMVQFMTSDDIVVDGGNSNFKDSVRRYKFLKERQIAFIDCGTSGGVHGKDFGFSLMIGGDENIFEKLEPIFKAIATNDGYVYLGPAGVGHYVKMVHNGIEYALLQSYAEGFNLLRNGEYENLDLAKISNVWSHGSIIRSWILDLAHNVFANDQELKNISGEIGENKTGQWTVETAKKFGVSVDLIERSLQIRAWSRESGGNYATKVVAMLRNQFGGHPLKKLDDK